MKIAFWKKLLSYFIDIRLEKKQSDYSGQLDVLLSRGRIALCTKNAMYSYEDLYLNFKESFDRIEISEFKIDSVLLLGAGLLSVPYMLEKHHNKKFTSKALDIDPAVLALAKKYTLPKIHSDIELICSDATVFVSQDKSTYDLVVVDIFIDDKVPSEFETENFLKSVQSLLAPNALIMFNRMAQNDIALKKTEDYYNQVFKSIFLDSKMLELRGNRMLIGINVSKN